MANAIFLCKVLHRCGTRPKVWEMTGEDADILCGEWDTNGSNGASTGGEKYNIALTIKEIVRHPDFPLSGPGYLQDDLAVFKVDEAPLSLVNNELEARDRDNSN